MAPTRDGRAAGADARFELAVGGRRGARAIAGADLFGSVYECGGATTGFVEGVEIAIGSSTNVGVPMATVLGPSVPCETCLDVSYP